MHCLQQPQQSPHEGSAAGAPARATRGRAPRLAALALTAAALALAIAGWAASPPAAQKPAPLPGSDACADCHSAGTRQVKLKDGEAPDFDAAGLRASPHSGLKCVECHADLEGDEEFPHATGEKKLAKVECGRCHKTELAQHLESLHGQAFARGEKLAPTCKSCHGTHNVLRPKDPASPTYVVNIPVLCNGCHREGSPVQSFYHIPQDSILTNYQESIHGVGLYRKGLLTTAVCTSCHTAHHQLPHTDPRSSIARANVARTCQQCHVRIEQVHAKVVKGTLWEKAPNQVPACVDCHQPHKIRRVFYAYGMSDQDCMVCHGKRGLTGTKGAKGGRPVSMFVDTNDLQHSRHAKISCAQCHAGITPSAMRPCVTVVPKVDCSTCHAEVVSTWQGSVHGKLAARGSPDAPECIDCHGTHRIKGRTEADSRTYPRNIPKLCGDCHRTGHRAAVRYLGDQTDILEHYEESIHGRGLLKSGLVVTATCADCHTAHGELPASDPASSVNPDHIVATCAKCHRGVAEQFAESVHSPGNTHTKRKLPTCADCHTSHSINRADLQNFRLTIMTQCGKCHEDLAKSYFDTYHGKVSKLGYLKTAKCYDCHGAHDILPVSDPASRLSRRNIVKTCQACHPGSNRRFAGYLTHATHHEPKKYPALFFVFWAMTGLLVVTFVVAGLHTLAWLPRSLQYRRMLESTHALESKQHVRRFTPLQRNLHLMVITSFITLAVTGMTLKFSYAPWAKVLSRLLGGFEAAGMLHRLGALVTFSYFGIHVYEMARRKNAGKTSWKDFIFGPNGMMFGPTDGREFIGSLKWFMGRGPRPDYGRWTYWEKFDYFAVFWGVAVIGLSGLLLWFPTIFTKIVPGWLLNVATIIHSDEALLAVGFIFTVHFFNTHFRPEKFPMDTVVFTQGIPLDEFKTDRPREYEELVKSGELEERLMPAPEPRYVRRWRVFGTIALSIGVLLILLILYSAIFGYR
jgi:cytochrome b subunit of formate dehydrogenase